jgi:CHASE2 domain-containing sensor protein
VETVKSARVAARRLILWCGLTPLVVTAALALYRPAFLNRLDYIVYDTLIRSAGTDAPSGRVVIVDVDERSLSALGQWPWRRDRIGQLVARLRDLGASVVALDMVFAEPDRYERSVDPGEARTNAAGLSGPDVAFAAALEPGRVVLGYALTFDHSAPTATSCVLHPVGLAIVEGREEENGRPFFRASGVICNLPGLARAAGMSGFLNAAPDADGILRRVPLLIELDGRVYPALSLAAVAATSGARATALRVSNVNATALSLGERTVPLDGKSNLLVRYRGPKRTFPYMSVAAVLDGSAPADAFRGKIVFVGATALGTREVVATPLDTLFAGVEVQATVADNLLTQHFIERPEQAGIFEMLAVLAVGLVVFLMRGRLAWGWVGAGVGLAAVWAGAIWLLSTHGWFLSPLFPTAGTVSALAAMTLAKVTVERRRADRSAEETVVSQRLMVQSLLSLTAVRDAETGRHSRRTQRYARLLADQLASHPRFRDFLTPERVELLSTLAPLHDIGKVGVPDRVLNKPGALTPEELEEIRKHPAHGRDVILQAEQRVGVQDDVILTMAKEIVYTHHERWDGTGYPERLAGEQIPIPGRVMALVDVYDAVLTRNVYRPSMPHAKAVDFIVSGKGTHFDPAVVEAFVVVAPVFERLSAESEL